MRSRTAAAGACLLVVLAGCGTQSRSAADQVPGLAARLTTVDDAIAAHHYRVARSRLQALVRRATAARDAGTLDEASAQRVLAAAAQLLGALPTPSSAPTTAATTVVSPTAEHRSTGTRHPAQPASQPAPKPKPKHGPDHAKGHGHRH